jgi:hypothetical protein
MLPSEKQLKSLVKKIKTKAAKRYELKQNKVESVDEVLDNSESVSIFQEMKKLPFSE